ncbi:Uncharacterised protein [uncultured archaeon]|nr:Uncharacterised protein [uncultured archaeon]
MMPRYKSPLEPKGNQAKPSFRTKLKNSMRTTAMWCGLALATQAAFTFCSRSPEAIFSTRDGKIAVQSAQFSPSLMNDDITTVKLRVDGKERVMKGKTVTALLLGSAGSYPADIFERADGTYSLIGFWWTSRPLIFESPCNGDLLVANGHRVAEEVRIESSVGGSKTLIMGAPGGDTLYFVKLDDGFMFKLVFEAKADGRDFEINKFRYTKDSSDVFMDTLRIGQNSYFFRARVNKDQTNDNWSDAVVTLYKADKISVYQIKQ